MNGWAIFLIVVLLLAALAAGGFFAYTRLYKGRFGGGSGGPQSGNYPSPAPSGALGWIQDKLAGLTRGRMRSSSAGYEPSGGGAYGRSGGGAYGGQRPRGAALDPDEAWDARVDNEAYFEEQELGLHAPTGYTGAGYGGPHAANPYEAVGGGGSEARGRELDQRYEEEMHGKGAAAGSANPFGDEHAAPSLRGVSPRPLDTGVGHGAKDESSPTERRSVFRENIA